jgi:general secretion pathway protein B
MSILLDALKRSEEQRRLGATPTLQTTVESSAAEGDSLQHWLPLLLMGVSVIAIAWFGLQQFRAPEETAAVSRPLAAKPPAEERSAPAPAATEPSASQQPPSAGGDRKRTPVESYQAEEAVAETAAQPAAEPAPGAMIDQPGQLDELREALAAGAEADAPAVESDQLEPEARAEETPVPPATRLAPHESEPISYWELPQSIRDDLPELRINVLVFADQPEDRFLLMGGQRLVENDDLGSGLVLEEIRREGAVFRYRKYRFFVKS